MTLETLKNPTQVEPEQQETVKRLKQVLGSMRLDREKGITVVVPKTPSSDFVDMFAILETALAPYLNDPFNPNRERAIRCRNGVLRHFVRTDNRLKPIKNSADLLGLSQSDFSSYILGITKKSAPLIYSALTPWRNK